MRKRNTCFALGGVISATYLLGAMDGTPPWMSTVASVVIGNLIAFGLYFWFHNIDQKA